MYLKYTLLGQIDYMENIFFNLFQTYHRLIYYYNLSILEKKAWRNFEQKREISNFFGRKKYIFVVKNSTLTLLKVNTFNKVPINT